MIAGNHADGSDSAVSINNMFLPCKSGRFNGLFIKHFRLNRIDLIKRFRRNTEFFAAEDILNIAFAVHHLFPFTEDHTRPLIINVVNNRCNFRMLFPKGFDKIIPGWKYRRTGDQNDHHLPGGKAPFYKNVTQKAVSGILIIGFNFERFTQLPNRPDDCVCQLVFDHTGFHRNHLMGSFFINAGNNISSAVSVKNRMDLIPVMIWIFHSDNGMDFAEFSH